MRHRPTLPAELPRVTEAAPARPGFGFALANRIGPLRRTIMREGLTPSWSTPRLMRGLDIAAV